MGNCIFSKNDPKRNGVYHSIHSHSEDSLQCPLIVLPKMKGKMFGEVCAFCSFQDGCHQTKTIKEVPEEFIPHSSEDDSVPLRNKEISMAECPLLTSTEITIKKIPDKTMAKIRQGLEQMDPRWPAQIPHLVAVDCLVRTQSFVDSLGEATTDPGILGYLIHSFYHLMDQKLDWYCRHLGLKSEQFNIVRTLIENHLTVHISPDFKEDEELRQGYLRDIELCRYLLESQVPPVVPTDYQQDILEVGVTYLKMMRMEQFPEWKWWCLNQWAGEVVKAGGGYPTPGDVLFTSLQCLLLAGGLWGLAEEFSFISILSHPARRHNQELLFFWNMLRVSMEVVRSLAGYVGPLSAQQLRAALNSTYFLACHSYARNIFLTERLLTEYRQVLDIYLLKPQRWRRILKKRLDKNRA